MENLRYYDPITNEDRGEVPNIFTIEDAMRKIENAEHRKSKDETSLFMSEKYGSFYFLFYKLNSSNIEKQYIIKFLYLCTYMDYDNKLVYGSNRRYMREDDLPEVLKLSINAANKTKTALILNGLMSISKDGNMTINKEYCLRGKIMKDQKKSMKTRLFENAIRELYEKATPREHGKLALLITLLPFINFNYNTICDNPEAEFEYQIKAKNLKDICKIVGYSERNVKRLKMDLLSLRVGGELVIAIVETGISQTVTINSRIYYRGSNLEAINELWNYFLIKN